LSYHRQIVFLDIAWPFALENIHVPFTNEILSHDDGRRSRQLLALSGHWRGY